MIDHNDILLRVKLCICELDGTFYGGDRDRIVEDATFILAEAKSIIPSSPLIDTLETLLIRRKV